MSVTKLLVKKILEHPRDYEWSFQGLGMLRCYLSREVRLHVWDPRLAVSNVSIIHTHPWNFESHVVAGRLIDTVYTETPLLANGLTHHKQTIQCGLGACVHGPMIDVRLIKRGDLTVGDSLGVIGYQTSYTRFRSAIHESRPEPGTVTIVERQFDDDTEHAYVYWPIGTQWVSAEPRPATSAEVVSMTVTALEWFR